MAHTYPFFHWPLEFPDVFERGGFDVTLGNPPWDQVQLDAREFFAVKAPAVAAEPNMAARNRAIAALASSAPVLHEGFIVATHMMEATQRFIHGSGRFPKTSYGRLNTAPLFAESCHYISSTAGRTGIGD